MKKLLVLSLLVGVSSFTAPRKTELQKITQLSGTMEEAWTPEPRDDFGKPLEPKGNRIYHGAGQRAWEFASYWYTVGPHKPALSKRYQHVSLEPASARLHELPMEIRSYAPGKVILELSMSMTKDGKSQCAEIARGDYDAHLDAIADALLLFDGAPVFIRPGYEFNGFWNGYPAADYVPAWKHVRQRILKKGVRNLAWVWCWIPETDNLDWRPYYPGDDQVDWWSIDVFKKSQIEHPQCEAFLREARRRKFPVLISESAPQLAGVADAQKAWDDFFGPYWSLMARHPNIKGFCMINRDWSLWPKYRNEWKDGRLDHNEKLYARWRKQLTHPMLLHANDLTKPNAIHLPDTTSWTRL